MKISKIGRLRFGLVAIVVLLCACGEELLVPPQLVVEDPDAFLIDGEVELVPVEGGCWSILADDGTRYEPLGLPEEFHEDGLKVRAAVKRRPDLASICMVGTIVEVVEIKRYTRR